MRRTLLLASLAGLLVASPALAEDRTWTGGGASNAWSDGDNWSPAGAPGGADRAFITLAGTYTVDLTANVSVAALTLGGTSGAQTLDATGFLLALGAGPSVIGANGVLLVGGLPNPGSNALTFDGPLSLAGRLDWGNGVIFAPTYGLPAGDKILTVAPGGLMRWVGDVDRTLHGTLVNQGTVRFEGGVTRYNQGYAHSSSGLFELAGATDVQFLGVGINNQGPWVFTNTGIVRKTGAGTATFQQIELRTIGGTVDVQQGTLALHWSSRHQDATVAVASGATYLLGGNQNGVWHEVAGSLSGSPAGTFVVDTQGWGSGMAADPAGGFLDLAGTGLQVRHTYFGGRSANSVFDPAPTNRGLVRFVGTNDVRIDRGTFRNEGTARWEDGSLRVVNTTFTNAGVFEIDVPAGRELLDPSGVILNTGTMRKVNAFTATLRVPLRTVGGTVDAQQGTLLLENGGRWENATVTVAAGATLHLSGNRTNYPHVVAGTLTGAPVGTFLLSGTDFYTTMAADAAGGTLNLAGTGLQVDNAELGHSGTPAVAAPTNAGLLRLVGTNDHQFDNGPFRNDGTLRWESGRIFVRGTTLTNAGLFDIAIAANWEAHQGDGMIRSTGVMRMTGAATATLRTRLEIVGGTVDVQAGTLIQTLSGRWENATISVAAGATLRMDSNRDFAPQTIAGTLSGDIEGAFEVGHPASFHTNMYADPTLGGRLNLTGTGLQVVNGYFGGNDGTTSYAGPTNAGLVRWVGTSTHFILTSFRNEGTFVWEAGQVQVPAGTTSLTNAGVFVIAADGQVMIGDSGGGNPATVLNEAGGTIRRVGTGPTELRVNLTNRGRLVLSSGTLRMLNVSNTFSNELSGTIAGVGTLDVTQLGSGNGRVENFGIVAPGPADDGRGVGTLTWLGAFVMDPQARVFAEAGPGPGGDRIAVTGTASLASQLVTRVIGGYVPAVGDAFDVLTATGLLSGTFATVATINPAGNVVFEPDYTLAGRVVLRAVVGQPAPPFVVAPSPLPAGGFRTASLLGDGFTAGSTAALVCVDCGDPGGPSARIEGEILTVAADRIDVRFDLTDGAAYGEYDLVLRAGNDSSRAPVLVTPYSALPLLIPAGPQALLVRPAPAAQTVLENLYNLTNAAEPTLFIVDVEPPAGPIRFDAMNVRLAPGETTVPRRLFVPVPATSRLPATLAFAGGIDPANVLFPGQTPLPNDPRVPFLAPQDVQFHVSGGVSPYGFAEYLAAITIEAAAEVGVVIPPDSALSGSRAVVDELLYGDGEFAQAPGTASAHAARPAQFVVAYGVLFVGGLIGGYFLLPEQARDGINGRLNQPGPTPPCALSESERRARIDELTREIDFEITSPLYHPKRVLRLNAERTRLQNPQSQWSATGGGCNRDDPIIPQTPRAPVDPNDKLAEEVRGCEIVGVGEDARCGRYLIPLAEADSLVVYTIKFENLPAATAPAENVTVTDILDPDLDPSTFEFYGSTADSVLTVNVTGQTVTFTFTGIDLPPNQNAPEGEGALTFGIRPRPGLADGTELRNSADIVFDFNPPIVTPEVVHVIRATADLALSVEHDSTGIVDQPVAYAFAVENRAGADPALAAALTIPVPAGTTVLGVASTVGTCGEAGGIVTCAFGTIAAGSSADVTLTLQPSQAGDLDLTAGVATTTQDANWYDDEVVVRTLVTPNTGTEDDGFPTTYVLEGNAPNPFATTTSIRYGLPEEGPTTLVVYDMLGRAVARLVDADVAAGWHDVRVDGSALASGVYVYQLRSGDFVEARRMLVVR